MNYNTITYTYAQLMAKAEQATSRSEAIDCIQQATKLRQQANTTYTYTNNVLPRV